MPYAAYIYSFTDLGLTGLPAAGTDYTTSANPSPDILRIDDSGSFGGLDNLFDAVTYPPGGLPSIDPNQVLATDLYVDTALVGSAGDHVFTDSASSTVTITGIPDITGYLVLVLPAGAPLGTPPTPVGFVTSAPIPASTLYTYTGILGPGSVPYGALANCFTTGTMIECENGPKAVQDITDGDLIITRDNGLQAVRWVGRRTVAGKKDMAPVRIKAGALGNVADLLVSPMHRMVLGGARAEVLFGASDVLAHASHLCDGDQIFREPVSEVTYFHLLFDKHEIIKAHGCWSESFAPSEAAMGTMSEATRAEILKLFPQLDDDWQDALPTLSAAEAQMALQQS